MVKHTAQLKRDNKENMLQLIHDGRVEVISGWQGFILVASVLDIAVSVPSTWSNCRPNPSPLHTTNLGPCPGTTVASLALQAPLTSSLQREMELFSIASDDNVNYSGSSFIYIFPRSQLPRGPLTCVRITVSICANISPFLQIENKFVIFLKRYCFLATVVGEPIFEYSCQKQLDVHKHQSSKTHIYVFLKVFTWCVS